jgi:protoporphyrin/coproporphyrin ferrochelatase
MHEGNSGSTAVLLMGYGSPGGPEDLPSYLAEVMGGRPPSPEVVAEYERRYELIGGSPQNRILESLRTKLERRLTGRGGPERVYLGTKHWRPHIENVLPAIAKDGFDRVIAVPLSPYASTWILEPYRRTLEQGRQSSPSPIEVDLRPGWHLNSHFIEYWSRSIQGARGPADDVVLLSAHSLPKRFEERGDPYPGLLTETSHAIATAAGLSRWSFTFQSAGNTTEPWLGPDITEVMLDWKRKGRTDQIIASFGFVFDHLETLYDLDVVVRAYADQHGIPYHRIAMPNDDDRLVEALADVVRGSPAP